jgi:hypothetical protein
MGSLSSLRSLRGRGSAPPTSPPRLLRWAGAAEPHLRGAWTHSLRSFWPVQPIESLLRLRQASRFRAASPHRPLPLPAVRRLDREAALRPANGAPIRTSSRFTSVHRGRYDAPRPHLAASPVFRGGQGRPLPAISSRVDEPVTLVRLVPVAPHLRPSRSRFVPSSLLLIGRSWTGSIPQSGGKPGVVVLDDLAERIICMRGRRPVIEVL